MIYWEIWYYACQALKESVLFVKGEGREKKKEAWGSTKT